jgi:hypothetical protein
MKVTYIQIGDIVFFQPTNKFSYARKVYSFDGDDCSVGEGGYPEVTVSTLFLNGSNEEGNFNILRLKASRFLKFKSIMEDVNGGFVNV